MVRSAPSLRVEWKLSPPESPANVSAQLRQIGLRALPADLDDFLARATKNRWSPQQLIEQLARAETE